MDRIEITICLGSSCFARGNQTIVHLVKDHLRKNSLEDRIFLRGAHCFNACKNGPSIKINDEYVHGVTKDNVIQLITKSLEKLNV